MTLLYTFLYVDVSVNLIDAGSMVDARIRLFALEFSVLLLFFFERVTSRSLCRLGREYRGLVAAFGPCRFR